MRCTLLLLVPLLPGGFYDDATYAVTANRLAPRHTTYPADAPVVTRQSFRRVER